MRLTGMGKSIVHEGVVQSDYMMVINRLAVIITAITDAAEVPPSIDRRSLQDESHPQKAKLFTTRI